MIAWFAKNGVAANLLLGMIVIAGIFSIKGMKMELFPDFDLDLVSITVPYPGAAPLEVEGGDLESHLSWLMFCWGRWLARPDGYEK